MTLRSWSRLAAISLAILLLVPLAPPALGGTTWSKTGTDFNSAGSKVNVVINSDGIRLVPDSAAVKDWTALQISSPPGRAKAAMACHSPTGLIVLFGGQMMSMTFNDTWVLNTTAKTWTQKSMSGSPPQREGHGMVYDEAHDLFIMFGGYNFNGALDDTWSYDLKTDHWNKLNPGGSIPGKYYFAMTYDSYQKKVVVMGGLNETGNLQKDTWAYDYDANAWAQKANYTNPRESHAMAYDSDKNNIVGFGDTTYVGDTYIYQPGLDSWSTSTPPGGVPGRFGNTLVYNKEKKVTVLFGGYQTGTLQSNDLWYFNQTGASPSWSSVNPIHQPPERYYQMMAYNNGTGEVVVFGGIGKTSMFLNDTWIYGMKKYISPGYIISEAKDLGGPATFGPVTMDADVPPQTSAGFQVRTGKTDMEMFTRDYVGPDGTATTSYQPGSTNISTAHDGDRWVQYKVTLASTNPSYTPLVKKVSLDINVWPNLNLSAPKAGDRWTGVNNITWTANDPDGDLLAYDVFLVSNSSTVQLASDLSNKSYAWDTTATANGYYKVRVLARDLNSTYPVTVTAESGWFWVDHAPPNNPPTVTLESPADASTVLRNGVTLRWNGSDLDGDELRYFVMLDSGSGAVQVAKTTNNSHDLTNLKDNWTYAWTVIPYDGHVNGTGPNLWTFNIDVNTPPRITSVPTYEAVVGQQYIYDVDVEDPDMYDVVAYSFLQRPTGMTVDQSSGTILWTPTPGQVGRHDVAINVSDGREWTSQQYTINVTNVSTPVNHLPVVTSTAPATAIVGYDYTYQLNVSDEDPGDTFNFTLEVFPAGMTVAPRTGLVKWVPDFGQLGQNSVTVRVSDGKANVSHSFVVTVSLSTTNHRPFIQNSPAKNKVKVGESFSHQVRATDDDGDAMRFTLVSGPPGMTIGLGTGVISWTPTKADIGSYTITVNVTDGKGGFDQQSYALKVVKESSGGGGIDIFTLVLIIIIVAVAVAAALGIAVWSRRRKAKAAAEAKAAEVVIDDIFLVYSDGRLISHNTRKLKPDVDDQVLSSMLTAVQAFVKDSMGADEETKAVNEISYGDKKILIEHGRFVFIAAVVSGKKLEDMHSRMRSTVASIEQELGPALKGWSGDPKELKDTKKWIQLLLG